MTGYRAQNNQQMSLTVGNGFKLVKHRHYDDQRRSARDHNHTYSHLGPTLSTLDLLYLLYRIAHPSALAMKAVATFHEPTSVVASVNTTLTDDEDVEFLVVAKSSFLEVFALLPESLRLQCRLEIWGRITSLQTVPTGVRPVHLCLS